MFSSKPFLLGLADRVSDSPIPQQLIAIAANQNCLNLGYRVFHSGQLMSSNKNIKDYYYILGIPYHASIQEIKTAYRKLSMKFHPDQNSGDPFFEERFKDLQEAYETLSDDIKRKAYDSRLRSEKEAGDSKTDFSGKTGTSSNTAAKPVRPKNKVKQFLYGILALIIFSSPAWLRPLIHSLDEKERADKDRVTSLVLDSTYKVPGDDSIRLSHIFPDDSAKYPPEDSVRAIKIEPIEPPKNPDADDTGMTPEDVVKYFFNAFNEQDCHKAWTRAYVPYWMQKGENWFCSSEAFGGLNKVVTRSLYLLSEDDTSAAIYANYYAADIYNGNKCFSQTIMVRKMDFMDNIKRWEIIKMKNIEAPADCSEN